MRTVMKAVFLILPGPTRDSVGAVSCNIWPQIILPLQHPWAQGQTHTCMHTHTHASCLWDTISHFTLCAVCATVSLLGTRSVVMPVVTQWRVTVTCSAVELLIVRELHIWSFRLFSSRPDQEVEWCRWHWCPLAAPPESSYRQEFKGKNMAAAGIPLAASREISLS